MGLALRDVRRGGRVDEARNGSGFESESGFREAFTKIFGEPPTTARARDPLLAERIDTPLGAMIAVADDEGLRLLEFLPGDVDGVHREDEGVRPHVVAERRFRRVPDRGRDGRRLGVGLRLHVAAED